MMVGEVGHDTELLVLGQVLADELNRFVPEGVRLTCELWQSRIMIFTNTHTVAPAEPE
jgi:hypothetical protein